MSHDPRNIHLPEMPLPPQPPLEDEGCDIAAAQEHYAESKRDLTVAAEAWMVAQATAEAENWPGHEAAKWCADYSLARAQVHATLALAAMKVG